MNFEEALNLGANMEVEVGNDNPVVAPQNRDTIKALGERTKRELLRHDVSDRDHRVAIALCDLSFGLGLLSVKIPKLETLGNIVGLPRQHVYTALQRLHERRIVTVRQKEGLYLYTLNPNSETWKVPPRVALAVIQRESALIRELNGIESEPSENSAPRDDRQLVFPSVTDAVTVTLEAFPSDIS